MKQVLPTILLLLIPVLSVRADDGWTPVRDVPSLVSRFSEASSLVRSIECRFHQKKYVDVLVGTAESDGFYGYYAPDSVVIEYVSPEIYTITVTGDEIRYASAGMQTVRKLSSDRRLSGLADIMRTGGIPDPDRLDAFDIEAYENSSCYMFVISGPGLRKGGIEVVADRNDMSLVSFRLLEGGNDYTEFSFSDKVILRASSADE